MTFPELQIQLDLNSDNRIDVLENADVCQLTRYGYLFVDQEDGQCYLFDINGNLDDINKVEIIGDYAFARCTSLICIKIPDYVKNIGIRAFYNCASLKSIKISDSVKNIRFWAFAYCEALKNIKIPNSVERIGYCAFHMCTSIVSIKIPDSVETIGYWAFVCCTSLKELIFEGKTMDEVITMDDYPWGIKDESIIKCLG